MLPPLEPGLLRVADTHYYLTDTLGPGKRAAVWVQGCSIHCEGCIVPESWNIRARGTDWDPVDLAHDLLDPDPEVNLTVSGGEPTEQAEAVGQLLATAKQLGRNTWMYTGCTLEELVARDDSTILMLLSRVDVLVDGPFQIDNAGSFRYRGSSNQRIIRLTDAISQNEATTGVPGRVEFLLDEWGELALMGIPVPGFMKEMAERVRARGLSISQTTKRK
jgi:anaerobic ribonucleoside-triphosphate reductase activating protein